MTSESDFSPFTEIWLEIGFGGAEHLIHLARQNPDIAIIGAEPFLNGVAKAVAGVEEHDLKNVFLHHGDARDVMDALPDSSLSRIYVLFPDPWPKARHNKRRIINETFLKDVHRLLRPEGEFYFASDIIDYVDWTLARLKKSELFKFQPHLPRQWRTPYEGWPGTRYESKAKAGGRPCHYLTFQAAS